VVTLKAKNGNEYECDLCIESRSTQRLYIHFVGMTLMEAVMLFGGQNVLPFEGYPEYVVLESISDAVGGVNVDLKKREIIEEQTEVEHGEEE